MLDITNYLPAGTSYKNFLKAYGVEERKFFFPYDYLTSVDRFVNVPGRVVTRDRNVATATPFTSASSHPLASLDAGAYAAAFNRRTQELAESGSSWENLQDQCSTHVKPT